MATCKYDALPCGRCAWCRGDNAQHARDTRVIDALRLAYTELSHPGFAADRNVRLALINALWDMGVSGEYADMTKDKKVA